MCFEFDLELEIFLEFDLELEPFETIFEFDLELDLLIERRFSCSSRFILTDLFGSG